MEIDLKGLLHQPVKIKMTNKEWEQELEVCCLFQPVLKDSNVGFQCGALLFGGPMTEAKLIFKPDGTLLLLFPQWNYEISPTSMETYEDSRDPFSDSECMTPEMMQLEVEEALEELLLPRWLEGTWNEYFFVRNPHEKTA